MFYILKELNAAECEGLACETKANHGYEANHEGAGPRDYPGILGSGIEPPNGHLDLYVKVGKLP